MICPHREPLLLSSMRTSRFVVVKGGFSIDSVSLYQHTTRTNRTRRDSFRLLSFILRWRTISYNITPAATDTFSDGTFPTWGSRPGMFALLRHQVVDTLAL